MRLLFFCLLNLPLWANSYTTSFPLTEFPISESGRWSGGASVGLDWSDIGTTGNHTYSTQLRPSYADATAILTGTWGSYQTVTVVASITSGNTAEIAIRVRSTVSAHVNSGYEIGWRTVANSSAYMGVTRWNGAYGDFTQVGCLLTGSQYAVANGDTLKVTAFGNTITAYKNGVLQIQVTDSTFSGGNPGMGLDGAAGTDTTIGISSFTATDTPPHSGWSSINRIPECPPVTYADRPFEIPIWPGKRLYVSKGIGPKKKVAIGMLAILCVDAGTIWLRNRRRGRNRVA